MPKNSNFKSNNNGNKKDNNDNNDVDNNGDDNETLRRGCCVKKFTKHMARVPFKPLRRGGKGSLFPNRSKIRNPTRPFASQSKTQGSPLKGYLS